MGTFGAWRLPRTIDRKRAVPPRIVSAPISPARGTLVANVEDNRFRKNEEA
jgi:hypothetical protein